MSEEEMVHLILGHDWWHTSTGESFVESAKELVVSGYTPEYAYEFVMGLYDVAAGEFGS